MTVSNFFVDLHIHVGQDWNGKPVKITGSKSLTLTNIVKEASRRKGLDMVGVIDAQAPAVQAELQELLNQDQAQELPEGGIQFEDTVLILGSEIEIYDAACSGPIHVLCYFPGLQDMRKFSDWLSKKMKNINLSSQRFYGTGRELQQYVHEHGGLFIPAHMFTPFKSMYGRGVKQSIKEVFDPVYIDAVELGLSSDTSMADQIAELAPFTYITNSDAHSLGKLAREYQEIQMESANFEELKKALHEREGRKVIANFGLNPEMGKYHQTVCAVCFEKNNPVDVVCTACGSKKIVKGVAERIGELASDKPQYRKRPPYHYQVPLSSLPGIGKKTYEKLLEAFQSEMAVIHVVPEEQLTTVVSKEIANYIVALRQGELEFDVGGGGIYGKVRPKSE